jgi:hypothetical protein
MKPQMNADIRRLKKAVGAGSVICVHPPSQGYGATSPCSSVVNSLFVSCLLLMAVAVTARAQVPASAEISLDRTNVFVNEIFNMSLGIDATGVRMSKDIQVLALPDKSRVFLGNFEELQPERRVQDNQVREIRRFRCAVRAMSPGTVELAPVLRARILTRQMSFFGFTTLETPFDIRVRPITISIVPLPTDGRPSDFSGAIGQFAFDVQASPTSLAIGDLVTVTMKIRGEGYLESMIPPRISSGGNLRTYDPKLVPGGAGEKVFEQTVIPQSTNAAIPSVSFSYFDARAAAYRTITRGPFSLSFHAAKTVTFQQYRPEQSGTTSSSVVTAPEVHQNKRVTGVGQQLANATDTGSKGEAIERLTSVFNRRIAATVGANETAMFAPSRSSLISFDIPKGSVVTVLERYGNWSKVAFGDKHGWIPTSSLR